MVVHPPEVVSGAPRGGNDLPAALPMLPPSGSEASPMSEGGPARCRWSIPKWVTGGELGPRWHRVHIGHDVHYRRSIRRKGFLQRRAYLTRLFHPDACAAQVLRHLGEIGRPEGVHLFGLAPVGSVLAYIESAFHLAQCRVVVDDDHCV